MCSDKFSLKQVLVRTKLLGMVVTDESIGVSQLLGAHAQAAPKSLWQVWLYQ